MSSKEMNKWRGNLICKCKEVSWVGFWNRKMVLVEKLVKYKKACSFVASGVLVLCSWAGRILTLILRCVRC